MTIGIYALYWDKTDSIYIGQSLNIEYRFKEHIRSLNTNKHYNHKVQEEFNKSGLPSLHILKSCTKDNLDVEEISIIEYFGINNTLNICMGGSGVVGIHGELHHNSKYTNDLIEEVFTKYLVSRTLTYKEISKVSNISESILEQIGSGYRHKWLQDKFPEKYALMLKANEVLLVHQSNVANIVSVIDIQSFCKLNKLDPSTMYKVINGHRNSHKGWRKFFS